MLNIDIDRQTGSDKTPTNVQFYEWAKLAYRGNSPAEIAIAIVNKETMLTLNKTYRGVNKPTNVLSFAAELEPIEGFQHLGDIALCEAIILEEAKQQSKSENSHWAHMTIHGMLHLQNYDHITLQDAKIMESLEISLMKKLGLPNPYE